MFTGDLTMPLPSFQITLQCACKIFGNEELMKAKKYKCLGLGANQTTFTCSNSTVETTE